MRAKLIRSSFYSLALLALPSCQCGTTDANTAAKVTNPVPVPAPTPPPAAPARAGAAVISATQLGPLRAGMPLDLTAAKKLFPEAMVELGVQGDNEQYIKDPPIVVTTADTSLSIERGTGTVEGAYTGPGYATASGLKVGDSFAKIASQGTLRCTAAGDTVWCSTSETPFVRYHFDATNLAHKEIEEGSAWPVSEIPADLKVTSLQWVPDTTTSPTGSASATTSPRRIHRRP